MKSRIFYSLLIAVLIVGTVGYCEEERKPPASAPQPPLSLAGLGALEHASKLIAAINALDWKTVDAAAPPKDNFLPLLKRDAAASKDWFGVGAYRGSTYDQDSRLLRHRFAYGPNRATPHEVWFDYSIEGDKFTLAGIMILGW
jgi:hypothetical protein